LAKNGVYAEIHKIQNPEEGEVVAGTPTA
jgi:hypothetical protein